MKVNLKDKYSFPFSPGSWGRDRDWSKWGREANIWTNFIRDCKVLASLSIPKVFRVKDRVRSEVKHAPSSLSFSLFLLPLNLSTSVREVSSFPSSLKALRGHLCCHLPWTCPSLPSWPNCVSFCIYNLSFQIFISGSTKWQACQKTLLLVKGHRQTLFVILYSLCLGQTLKSWFPDTGPQNMLSYHLWIDT